MLFCRTCGKELPKEGELFLTTSLPHLFCEDCIFGPDLKDADYEGEEFPTPNPEEEE